MKSLNNKRALMLIPALLLIVAGVAVVSSAMNTNSDVGTGTQSASSPQLIAPLAYVSQFRENPTPHILLDVRTPEEFRDVRIPGAINIPLQSLENRLAELPQNQTIVLYCRSGNRSADAARILAQAGYGSVYDMGGIIAWDAAGLPVE
jgi:rhodanese-related sulfurtransferase